MNTSFLFRCVEAARRFDRAVLPLGSPVSLTRNMAALLGRTPLVVADVGAAGGLDLRWDRVKDYVRFLTFEPRAEDGVRDPAATNFPVCLGAEKGKKTLYLTQFSQSSSLYPLNQRRLQDFAVRDCFTVLGTMPVEVDTLDNCATGENRTPHFLKVDVEGAELDVLKGAQRTLESSLLGLRIEISFLARHVGAPLFGDVDAFLQGRGYEAHALSREHMIRYNMIHSVISQPQLVWGDAQYFLTRQAFVRRLSNTAPGSRLATTSHFLLILLCHGVHDFAMEVVEAAQNEGLLARDAAQDCKVAVLRSVRRCATYPIKALAGACLALGIYVAALPSKKAREQAMFYLKRRAGCLFHYLWRATARGGACNASVSDILI